MKTYRLGTLAVMASLCIALSGCGQPGSDRQGSDDGAVATSAVEATDPAQAAAERQAARAEAERERVQRAETERLDRMAKVRQADPALNWINIGISTSKTSEDLHTGVHRTYAECVADASMEDNNCIPIAKLPDSYWKAGE